MLNWKTEYHKSNAVPAITGWYIVGYNESGQVAQAIGPYPTREAAEIDAPSAIGG